MYAEMVKRQADGTRDKYFNDLSQFEEDPVHYTTNEAKGKLRDLSGWVISQEIKVCISYVSLHKCSKSPKVTEEVEEKRKMKAILDQLKGNKDEMLDGSKYPESLEHITLYDRGGKTCVTDAVFEFFCQGFITCISIVCR